MTTISTVDWSQVGLFAAGIVAIVGIILGWILYRKGRPFAPGDVFRASRLSKGNRVFPTQIQITPTTVVHHTPQWFGKYEHSIHMAHIASVGIDTHVIFSDVYIETSGGTEPIKCTGHHKGDAVRMKQLIEQYQTAYYSGGGAKSAAPPSAAPAASAAPAPKA